MAKPIKKTVNDKSVVDMTTDEDVEDVDLEAEEEAAGEEDEDNEDAEVISVSRKKLKPGSKPSVLNKVPGFRYLQESLQELKKVNWPTRDELRNMSILVVVVSAIVAAILGAADYGLSQGVTWLLGSH